MRAQARDHSRAGEPKILVASAVDCPECEVGLGILRNRHRFVETLDGLVHLVSKWKTCRQGGCIGAGRTYRPAEEGRIVLKDHEFGLDVLLLAGEQYLFDRVSVPRIHKRLRTEYGVHICERSVGNLVDDYIALCECVAADEERLQKHLREQGAIVLAVDGVHFDGRSAVLYVLRDILSAEVLYAERRPARSVPDLLGMLTRVRDLAARLGIPIVGTVSDKERSLVPAIRKVFPEVPHQYCQSHYLGNLARPLADDNHQLEEGVQEVVYALREVERALEHLGPKAVDGADHAEPKAEATKTSAPAGPTMATAAATTALPQPPLPAEAALAAEVELAHLLVDAGKTAGVVCGRPITDPPGLKRFQHLEQVAAHTAKAARKKGAPADGWQLIQAILTALSLLDALRPVAARLARHVEMVRHIAHILASRKPAREVKRQLSRYLNRLQKEAPRRGRGALTGRFVDHLVKVSRRYWPGLFHTYDDPRIPSTTNELESLFGSTKRAARRTSGRKSTVGGKLESIGEALVRVQALLQILPRAQLTDLLANVPPERFATSEQRLSALKEPARRRRSYQRDPERYMKAALGLWLGS